MRVSWVYFHCSLFPELGSSLNLLFFLLCTFFCFFLPFLLLPVWASACGFWRLWQCYTSWSFPSPWLGSKNEAKRSLYSLLVKVIWGHSGILVSLCTSKILVVGWVTTLKCACPSVVPPNFLKITKIGVFFCLLASLSSWLGLRFLLFSASTLFFCSSFHFT